MQLFLHLIYEYRKGLRRLVLYTTKATHREEIERKLVQQQIAHLIHDIGAGKINVFFGDRACIDVLGVIGKRNVARFSDEEDFILGAMLGYDTLQQCQRYVSRKSQTRRNAEAGSTNLPNLQAAWAQEDEDERHKRQAG